MDHDISGLKAAADVCTLCGNCVNECPLFKADLTEPSSPRGMINLIKEMIDGDLGDSRELNDRIASCLLCGNCGAVCSKGIDIIGIITGYRAVSRFRTGIEHTGQFRNIINENPVRLSAGPERNKRYDVLLFPGYLMLMKYPEAVRRTIDVINSAGLTVLLTPDLDPLGSYYLAAGYSGEFRDAVKSNINELKKFRYGDILCMNGKDAHIMKNEYGVLHGKVYELMEFSLERLGNVQTAFEEPGDLSRSALHTSLFDRNYLNAGDFERLFLESRGDKINGLPPSCCGSGLPAEAEVSGRVTEIGRKFLRELRARGIEQVITSSPECYDTIRKYMPDGARFLIEIFIP